MEIQLRSNRFRREREDDWRRLERILRKAEQGSIRSLTDEELLALPVLYRSALSSLTVARAMSLDRALEGYLESLATRAYFFVYGPRSTFPERLAHFLRTGWPDAVRGLWRETAVAALVMLLGAVAAYVLVSTDPDWYYAFVPAELAGDRDPAASTSQLRETLYSGPSGAEGFLATFLFVHNARIAMLAFALGFAFCLPTALLVAYNGCVLGAFLALFFQRGLGFEVGGWLLIHGVTELFAVTLAGAAGFRLGWAIAFPGSLSRLDSARAAGGPAALAMAGVVIMLLVAGVLEGVGRQTITNDAARYAIALGTAVLWGAYFYGPAWRRSRERV